MHPVPLHGSPRTLPRHVCMDRHLAADALLVVLGRVETFGGSYADVTSSRTAAPGQKCRAVPVPRASRAQVHGIVRPGRERRTRRAMKGKGMLRRAHSGDGTVTRPSSCRSSRPRRISPRARTWQAEAIRSLMSSGFLLPGDGGPMLVAVSWTAVWRPVQVEQGPGTFRSLRAHLPKSHPPEPRHRAVIDKADPVPQAPRAQECKRTEYQSRSSSCCRPSSLRCFKACHFRPSFRIFIVLRSIGALRTLRKTSRRNCSRVVGSRSFIAPLREAIRDRAGNGVPAAPSR